MTTTQQEITIEVSDDGRAIVRIDARPHFIQQQDVDTARRAALRHVFETIAPTGPITLTATENGHVTPLVMDTTGAVRVAEALAPPQDDEPPATTPADAAQLPVPIDPAAAGPPTWGPPAPRAPVNGYHNSDFQGSPPVAGPAWPDQQQPIAAHQAPPVAGPAWPDQQQQPIAAHQAPAAPPSLQELRARLTAAPDAPATWGWRGRMTRAGMKMGPGADELAHRRAAAAVQRSLRGPKTIAVVNIKGGANKTGSSFLLGATIGRTRGGFTLAWDNNENMGTLAQKGISAPQHRATVVDLLRELERFESLERSRVGDLDNYMRGQGDNRFDILASDEDASSMAAIDADAFQAMHRVLQRFYRVIIVDTGNNVKASNFQAAIESADQLVVATTAGGDEVAGATFTLEHLQQHGNAELARNAVTILSKRDRDVSATDMATYSDHLSRWTRAVVQIPYDPAMPRTTGAPINYDALSPASREAWLHAAATVIGGLD